MGEDMTLKQFVESTWFKGLARGAMIAFPLAAGYVGMTLANVQGRVGAVETSIATIGTNQVTRATDNERFQTLITSEVRAVDANVDTLGDKFETLQIDVATIKGILTELQRRDVAERTGLRVP